MNWWLFFFPLVAACIGWWFAAAVTSLLFRPYYPKKIAGFTLQGLVPKRQKALAATAGRLSASLFSVQEIEQKITDPENVKTMMPRAEAHIDEFLRVKLVKAMPVVGMFVGDKTINSLKLLFVKELETLFPEIMKNYMSGLQKDLDIEKIVSERIAAIPPGVMEKTCLQMMKKEWQMIKLTGALMGFVISLLQTIITLLMH